MFQNNLFLPFISAVAGAFGAWLTYRLVGKRRMTLAHRYRIIEQHTKAIHRYLEQYYVPYITLSTALEKSLNQERDTKSQAALELSFFRFAQWVHIYYKWWRDIGSIIILRDPTAEKILAQMAGFSKFLVGQPLGIVERHMLMNIFECNSRVRDFFSEFKKKLDERPLETIFKKYKQWLKKEEIPLLAKELRCFSRLFDFEINMCYEPWYARKPVKPNVDFGLVREKLNELLNNREVTLREAKKYLRRLGAPKAEIQKFPTSY